MGVETKGSFSTKGFAGLMEAVTDEDAGYEHGLSEGLGVDEVYLCCGSGSSDHGNIVLA